MMCEHPYLLTGPVHEPILSLSAPAGPTGCGGAGVVFSLGEATAHTQATEEKRREKTPTPQTWTHLPLGEWAEGVFVCGGLMPRRRCVMFRIVRSLARPAPGARRSLVTRVRRRVARLRVPRTGPLAYLAALGPGLIAANAGNDAGGIATYSSVGASYGYSLLWMMVVMTVSLGVVQEMCARMGAATGKGLSALMRENFGVRLVTFAMLALFIANGGTAISEFAG